MKISVAVCGDTATAPVPQQLSAATHLFIVETEQNQCLQVLDVSAADRPDEACAQLSVQQDCEAIVCGAQISQAAFDILANAQVTRFDGGGLDASRASHQAAQNELPLIREYYGGAGCHGAEKWQELHPEKDYFGLE